ncbi:hypothetical protein POKO110462_13380 [Pontibacter korlensis]|uniref:hypothetical protein n=1 Tax=Pontibacter korlensis TaxID=400092 RepID=UPI000A6E3B4A|nr:hypothetical protein [Pontibacter korlensis]
MSSSLSSDEFVGTVADETSCPISLKAFHASILNDHQAHVREEKAYRPIPGIRQVDPETVQRQYRQVKQEVQHLIASILTQGSSHP